MYVRVCMCMYVCMFVSVCVTSKNAGIGAALENSTSANIEITNIHSLVHELFVNFANCLSTQYIVYFHLLKYVGELCIHECSCKEFLQSTVCMYTIGISKICCTSTNSK